MKLNRHQKKYHNFFKEVRARFGPGLIHTIKYHYGQPSKTVERTNAVVRKVALQNNSPIKYLETAARVDGHAVNAWKKNPRINGDFNINGVPCSFQMTGTNFQIRMHDMHNPEHELYVRYHLARYAYPPVNYTVPGIIRYFQNTISINGSTDNEYSLDRVEYLNPTEEQEFQYSLVLKDYELIKSLVRIGIALDELIEKDLCTVLQIRRVLEKFNETK